MTTIKALWRGFCIFLFAFLWTLWLPLSMFLSDNNLIGILFFAVIFLPILRELSCSHARFCARDASRHAAYRMTRVAMKMTAAFILIFIMIIAWNSLFPLALWTLGILVVAGIYIALLISHARTYRQHCAKTTKADG